MTVREMLARIDSYELSEWAAFENRNGPLGPARGDYHAALISSTTANTVNKKTLAVSDFMPDWADRGEVLDDGDDP